MPVIIHSRHSDEDMLSIVNQYPDVKKVFHCYATNSVFFDALEGDQNYASFTGMVTYAKKGKVINAMKHIPFNRLMIETDSPYLTPKDVLLIKIVLNMWAILPNIWLIIVVCHLKM